MSFSVLKFGTHTSVAIRDSVPNIFVRLPSNQLARVSGIICSFSLHPVPIAFGFIGER